MSLPEVTTAEATGATVAEAKSNALHELARAVPAVDPAAVRYQVIDAGSRGLLGVGSSPARVIATAEAGSLAAAARPDESEVAALLRDVLEHVTAALGLRCRVVVAESPEALEATCSGGDLGLLIGRRGQTIDAVQTLAAAIVRERDEDRRQVVVDAGGYRARRRRVVESAADRAAADAVRSSAPVALESMSAAERRIAHERLAGRDDVRTSSEGEDPDRHVVVLPGGAGQPPTFGAGVVDGRAGEARPS